jgi:hypothetical protein
MTASAFNHSAEQHATDGELLALHDEEGGARLDGRRRHVEQCAECRARLAVMANDAHRVREAIALIPIPPLDSNALRVRIAAAGATKAIPGWRRPMVQAAAALVVVTVAAAASPARHWLLERFGGGRVAARTVLSRSPNEPAAPPRPISGATVAFFAPGPSFTMRLDVSPVAGSLVPERTTADQISVQVASGAGTGGDSMVVLPRELRVHNTASSRATYRMAIPSGIARVTIIVAGRIVFDGSAPAEVRLTR